MRISTSTAPVPGLFLRLLACVLLCLFTLLPVAEARQAIAVPGLASGIGSDALAQRAAPLLEQAQATGKIRVIVQIQPPGQASLSHARRDPMGESQRLNAIAQAQRELLSRLQVHPASDAAGRPAAPSQLPTGISQLRLYRSLPYLSLFADHDTLQALLADPQVLHIQQDLPRPSLLLDSATLINADQAWVQNITGNGMVVAILDTGVDKNHPFFQGRVLAEACYSSNTESSSSLCPGGVESSTANNSGLDCTDAAGCGHGTRVAGIAAGADGPAGLAGIAKGVSVIAVQVFSLFNDADCTDAGYTSPCVYSWSTDQISALEYLAELASEINIAAVNMSLGGDEFPAHCDTDPVKAPIDNLLNLGIHTVIATGNAGHDNAISAPACISTAIAVASSQKDDTRSNFSNWGSLVDVVAPGGNISTSAPDDGYQAVSGTSMAAPHVAGTLALLKQAYPGSSAAEREAALKTTPTSITAADVSIPRIDITAALDYLHGQYFGALQVNLTPEAAITDGAQWRRVGTSTWRNSGETESDLATGDYTVEFQAIAGWTSPANEDVSIEAGTTAVINAHYLAHGSLQVNINPEDAVTAGAQWSFDGTNWLNSGEIVTLPAGDYTIHFSSVDNWQTPANQNAIVESGVNTTIEASYVAYGQLQVHIDPEDVRAEARWRLLDSSIWFESGHSESMPAGEYHIEFSAVDGWISPVSQTVTISSGDLSEITATYIIVTVTRSGGGGSMGWGLLLLLGLVLQLRISVTFVSLRDKLSYILATRQDKIKACSLARR